MEKSCFAKETTLRCPVLAALRLDDGAIFWRRLEASWTASSALKASAEGSTITSATVQVSNGDTQFAVCFLHRSGKRSIDKMVLRAMVEVLGSQKSINVIRIAIEEPSMPRHRGKGVAGGGGHSNNWPCFRVQESSSGKK